MQISIDYTVAINVLITCSLFETEKITANFIVQKIGSDGTTVREIMSKLKKAGFITNKPGPGGTKLVKALDTISLYDVYKAVLNPEDNLLKLYEEKDNQFTLIVNDVINTQFNQYRNDIFNKMKKMPLSKLCEEIKNRS